MTLIERNWVEWKYPGWKRTIESEEFMAWLHSQSTRILDMAERSEYGDIVSVLELYQLDSRSTVCDISAALN